MELTAFPLLTADGDRAAHRVYDIFRDRHSQTGSLGLLHAGIVLPAKGIEYDLLVLFRHTDPRITHNEMGADAGRIPRQRFLVHTYPDGAPIRREFDGVPQQVDQHLVQAHAVAAHDFRKDLISRRVERLVFRLDLRLHDIDNAVHDLPQRHHADVERHLSALDLRYIQHVVDESEQVLARQVDLVQVFLNLFLIVRVGKRKGCHADDRVHGRADIVAHARQKFLFCRARMLGLYLRLFCSPARRVNLCIDALELGYLFPEHAQILEKYVEQHGNHRKG